MGCGVSRIDANGLTFPVKIRPLFLHRLEEISTRRQGRPLKESTPSKKELLLHDKDEDYHEPASRVSSSPEAGLVRPRSIDKEEGMTHEVIKGGNGQNLAVVECLETKGKDKLDKVVTDTENDMFESDDDDDDDERRIGRHDAGAFPGSPSFRVYFHDSGEEDDHGKDDGSNDSASNEDTASSKESSMNEQAVKSGRKRRSFRKVLPKNLLNVKSCYTSSHSSHDKTLLLTEKPSH